MPETISADFPFESKYLNVLGSKMHYIDEGKGDPILFLHGNPTSSYLWRNIIPHMTDQARCIAVDLIGMGKSDKPDIDYRYLTHYKYLETFIEQLNLENITLVIHDWGSGLGFHYAHKHPQNIKGMAFMEAICNTVKWSDFPKGFKMGFKMMRSPGIGWLMISVLNMFIKEIMPKSIVRKLSPEEEKMYLSPFKSISSRKPIRQWPCEIPIDGKPRDVHQIVNAYHEWLKKTTIPKLLFSFKPGGLISQKQALWISENFPNTTHKFIGKGLHYVQEDHPHEIGENLKSWYNELVVEKNQ